MSGTMPLIPAPISSTSSFIGSAPRLTRTRQDSTPSEASAMSSEPPPKFSSIRASTRLSLGYSLMLVVGVGALFVLAYMLLARVVEKTDREVLESKLGEYAAIYESGGFRALEWAVQREDQSGQQKSLFVRLANARNDVTLAKVPDEWIAVQR